MGKQTLRPERKKNPREYFFFFPSNLLKLYFSRLCIFSSPGPFFGSAEKTHFPPTPRNQAANQAANIANFFPGEFFVDFFYWSCTKKKKNSPGTNSAARVGGCREKFEFCSWVLPGGPPFAGTFFSHGRKSKFCTVVKKMR